MDAWAVFLAALVTALATGLGAAPFLFRRGMARRWLGVSNAVASGVMLAASVGLLREGVPYGLWRVALGAFAGLVLIAVVRRLLRHRQELDIGALHGVDARKAFLIVAVMTAHSFAEGVGVGVAFGGGEALGVFITVAIAVHNIPEGLAISLVLVPRGVAVAAAAAWSIVSSLPQPIMAVPAFVFVDMFEPILPVGLGFAAGAMVWMVATELAPDALDEGRARTVLFTGLVSFAGMFVFQEWVL
jgi:zinc transporter, ZIP family